jgi:hypothetical protein
MGAKRNDILLGKPEGNRPLKRHQDVGGWIIIKMDLRMGWY